MKPHDKLTIIRNRHRATELRRFRDHVMSYFQAADRDPNNQVVDPTGAQIARSAINQMLPRVIQIVRAAGLGETPRALDVTDPGPRLGRVEVLHRIFSARYLDGLDQEILDVIDMAIGVYDGDRAAALLRTVNPLHYAGLVLGFVARGPRSLFRALGFQRRVEAPRLGPADVVRLEALAAKLADAEDLIDARLASLWDAQAQREGDQARQLAELAERLDFAERVLARQPAAGQLPAPRESEIPTPV